MNSLAPRRSLFPVAAAGEDPYQTLLSETRALQREQRAQREGWLTQLELEGRDDVLFEFEVLLKAAACFSNPRNHPGPPRRTAIVALDFRHALAAFHDGLTRSISLARQLLGPADRAFVFHRYLETVLPEDNARTRLISQGSHQGTPEESLTTLRHGLTAGAEVIEGLLRSQRVPFRLFHAALSQVYREIDRSQYFNPLSALEFRPEFDRIKSAQVLELIRSVPGAEAHRLVALTFLSLFRMLRYLTLINRILSDPGKRREQVGSTYLVLSVLRSDARALSDYLRQRSGQLLAESFERDLMGVPASQIRERTPTLRASGHRLIGIKSALEGIAGSLRLELRRAFQHDIPGTEEELSAKDFKQRVLASVGTLRPALQNAVLFLGKALGVTLEEGGVFDAEAERRETSERLRRDVWMFAQIVRAFSSKAQHSPTEDRWAALSNFQYVREFLAYFRAMGYPLLRSSDYPRFDAFMAALSGLEDTDLVDPARLEAAIDECVAFHGFLIKLFDDISRRTELAGAAFDRRAAAAALKLYLGD
ncbi:MAG TPA: hypothetical protein VHB79_15940 [Polyangiaceae bacterium]|nr:hypothetical protein [Polyangiaceae bacterium]